MKSEEWDRHWLGMALYHSKKSKDPSTKVGSLIIDELNDFVSAGFNGFPRGIADTPDRLNDRETKLKLVVHAEMNALLLAARRGSSALHGCTMYMVAHDAKSGLVWGGCPCTRCTVELIQAGIAEVVTYPIKDVPSRWHASIAEAESLLKEAGVAVRYLDKGDEVRQSLATFENGIFLMGH